MKPFHFYIFAQYLNIFIGKMELPPTQPVACDFIWDRNILKDDLWRCNELRMGTWVPHVGDREHSAMLVSLLLCY